MLFLLLNVSLYKLHVVVVSPPAAVHRVFPAACGSDPNEQVIEQDVTLMRMFLKSHFFGKVCSPNP